MSLVKITQTVGRTVLKSKKNSPHIFFAAGVVGAVGATVLACRATLQVSETLDTIKSDMEALTKAKEFADDPNNGDYTEIDFKRDTLFVYTRSTYDIVKLYAPAVIVGGVAIALLTGSHIQLSRRNASLMAAYGAVQAAYESYRERVRAEIGEEKELDIYRGVYDEKHEVDGKIKALKVYDPNKLSEYARIFDEYSTCWEKDAEVNRLYVQCQQKFANDKLIARGHLFLNEVYDMLGLERSRAGAVVGWVIGPDGDNFVDFGMFEAHNSRFINNLERSIILDFNVDGVILDKI